ncbi:IS1595-like element ISFlsp4 family transposase [Flavobacterium crassostreae]|uniref:Transposase n=3 Tax=Flavobacterium TaxID=237 RepID=A0A1B9DXV6_9FLAO|nr:IS1595-like element ISFlsp4 family transposase [Flavobacterium crassostreae]OCB74519.1 transposase [Flavobacterium crassostreae]
MESFKGESIIDFFDTFKTDLTCLEYLASIKWKDGFKCSKCNHKKFTIRKLNFARDCNLCHHVESPTANTIFHKVKFGTRKAFGIVFEMSATTKSLSSSQMAKRYSISRPTAWLFMHKVRLAMKSSALNPIVGTVYVDEFVYGGKEDLKQGRSNDSKKKKIVAAVEIDDKGGVKRAYFKRIDNYSSSELGKIFESHISTQANIKTDQWTGYKPLKNEYNIEQIKSNTSDFFQMNTIIHQVKSWLRSIYSWMHEQNIERYLDEYSYRLNRSIYKETIFDNLIIKMMKHKHIGLQIIKIST